ncbi:uncharacterized protein UV8b_01527 [Ustilaginoidea virens]|uniref:Methyltransferase domain-containing protein n=1 Tax=Ustilaginoidea virens TaxID=1159556 RepID=A0A8E5MFB1_USTVR|nr:uncharacterized protein UV8b_01527 [Ustilaginoidea virens]QUC17286.1 hypothetical protein UV8b_01527 [Ustilaginoidea virens]
MDAEDGTVPLDESFTETVEYHGRLFQKYALTNGVCFSPVDEDEVARLELMHSVLCRVFDNRLIFPPVTSPRRVLDCGFGAGDWAIDVAKHFPSCEVIGIDISPHMIPEDQPPNLDLQIDDLNARFTFPSAHFDMVHSQMVSGGIGINRWRGYMQDIFRVLRPGGWCQMVEVYLNAQSDNGTLTREHALSKWSSHYLSALHPFKNPRAALQLTQLMEGAGFAEVESRLLTLPMCPWSSEARERDIGLANVENIPLLLRSLGLYPLTELKGMPVDEFDNLIGQAMAEAGDASYKAYFPLYVCIGRKPRR